METEILKKKEIELAPKLRFREFGESWNKSKLGILADIKRGAGSQYIKYVNNSSEGIRLIRIGDFLGSEPVYVDKTKDIDRFQLRKGDILIAGTGATAGITFLVPDKFVGLAYSYNAPRITVKKADERYVIYYLKSGFILRQQQKLFTGNAQPFLDTKAIGSFRLCIPTLPEQQKIATFLSEVDKKIEQLTRKKELLETYKKGVMQQLFSQQLRFKDEDGNDFPKWEVKRLGELFIINAGGDIIKERVNKVKFDIFKYPIYANSEKNKGLYGFSNTYKVDFDCVTITGRGALGIAHARFEKFYPIVRLLILKPKRESDMIFFENHINGLNIYCESTGVPQLTAPQISTYKISYPCIQEQQKIADFLSRIDIKIEAVSQQITKTKSFKKGLLQQMFV